MHVSDGILATPVVVGGWAVAGLTTGLCLPAVKEERIPQTAIMTACFFVAGTIHVPLGGTSFHLVLNGLCGIVLGPLSFLAVGIGLLLQSVLLSHGGISALGFNACAMGLSAVAAWGAFRLWCAYPRWRRGPGLSVGAFLIGGGAVLLSNGMVWAGLALSGKTLAKVGCVVFLVHVVIAGLEGLVTAGTVKFLLRVEPRLLGVQGRG